MSNSFRCPKCGSDNIQSYEVIYNGGRATQTSTTDGISVGSDFSVGHANTSGRSITHLAQTCTPPIKNTYNGMGCLTIVVILPLFLAMIHPVIGIIIFIVGFMLWRSRVKSARAYIDQEFPKIYEEWQHSYYCHRCGNRFIIDGENDS